MIGVFGLSFFKKSKGVLFVVGATLLVAVFASLLLTLPAPALGGGSPSPPKPSCVDDPPNTSPPVIERVSGYAPPSINPAFAQFQPHTGGRPLAIPQAIKSTWFKDMPSPVLNCSGGLCLDKGFPSSLKTVRIAAISATPQIPANQMGALKIPRVGLDLVSSRKNNNCNKSLVHWAYATAPTNNATPTASFKVPKDTKIDLLYACQPNHDHSVQTKTACFLFIGSCNIADHNHIFRLADKARIDGVSGPTLYKTEIKTASGGETFTLQCGGFQPEHGTAANGGLPKFYDRTNVHRGNDLFQDHPDTYGFFNATAPSYYHPQIALTVEACLGDNEVVQNVSGVQTCVPCTAPTPYRVGNICVAHLPPTATLSVNGAPDGQSVVVPANTQVSVAAVYTPSAGDTLTASAINDDKTGSSVSCPRVSPRTNNCWTRPDAAKTYTFTPQTSDTGKTFTFSAQMSTASYAALAGYKTVSVTVGDACPSDATANPDGTCTCAEQYYSLVGSSCVLFCPPSMEPDGTGSCMPSIPALPSADDITFEATRVRAGNPSTLTFTINNMLTDITCTITPTPASGPIAWDNQPAWSGMAQTVPIIQASTYTLTCTNGVENVSKSALVNIIPAFQEI